jgi:CBS domain-containing protein
MKKAKAAEISAGGDRTAGTGISNQPTAEENASQAAVPPRGGATEPSWTRQVGEAEEGELMARTVRDVMTVEPTALDLGASVTDATRAMRDGNIGDVLVTEAGRLVGILTDRDVVVRVVAEGRDASRTLVGDVCSRRLATLDASDAVDTAVAKMREASVRRLPVVEGDQLVGIVALGDLAMERAPNSVLGAISTATPTR